MSINAVIPPLQIRLRSLRATELEGERYKTAAKLRVKTTNMSIKSIDCFRLQFFTLTGAERQISLSLNCSDMVLLAHYKRTLSVHYFQAKSRIIWLILSDESS